ncbi:Ring finger domain/Zn-finger in ubiquitin-hydrolase [Novymonas esmeraldas]|uniref:Ring finger domain/Zn-finger in ubiquitin-hydrolase n=1 Tax=Novymonas esmeraldas TaxID=1808958 RepID=A0AAW0ENH7_9TRYP
MELLATMALDRDALHTVTLRLLPPSTTTPVSPWLLVHTIPITASLSRTLSRLASLEATAHSASPTSPSPPNRGGRRAGAASPALSSSATVQPAPSTSGAAAASGLVLCGPPAAAAAAASTPLRCAPLASSSSSLSSRSSSSSSASSPAVADAAEAARRRTWIELVRVGYIVSEIHAYCLLLRCRHPTQAATLKAALEEGAALGLTAPVEYVCDALPVSVTRRVFAAATDALDGATRPGGGSSSGGGGDGGDRYTTSLWDAVSTVYTTRGDDGECRGDGHGSDGESAAADRRCAPPPPLLSRSQPDAHHLHTQCRLHSCSSVPSTPPPPPPTFAAGRHRATTTADGVRKGAAPPPRQSPSPATAATTPHASPRHAMTSPLQLQRQAPQHPPHTPLRLPLSAAPLPSSTEAGGGGSGSDTCAICFDSLQHHGACVMTLCQHVFHLRCYGQLPSSSAECPLCRFSVYDLLNDARCRVCGTYEDLWVCLLCGHVACGRARHDHQHAHYHASGHSCSWQSSTNRIRNLSSRMFLHQEVALLLEEEQRVADDNADDRDVDADRAALMSWCDSPTDPALQVALQESREDAVDNYYATFLARLAAEQQQYYDGKLAERRIRRQRRAAARATEAQAAAAAEEAAAAAAAVSSTPATRELHLPSPTSMRRAVLALCREERRQRRRVLGDYVAVSVDLLHAAQRACTDMARALRTARDNAQQHVLLRSHLNTGLLAEVEQVRARAQESQRSGAKATAAKAAEEARLQSLVDEALAAL